MIWHHWQPEPEVHHDAVRPFQSLAGGRLRIRGMNSPGCSGKAGAKALPAIDATSVGTAHSGECLPEGRLTDRCTRGHVAQTLANLSCETWVPHRGVCVASGSSGGWHAGLMFKRLVERSTMSSPPMVFRACVEKAKANRLFPEWLEFRERGDSATKGRRRHPHHSPQVGCDREVRILEQFSDLGPIGCEPLEVSASQASAGNSRSTPSNADTAARVHLWWARCRYTVSFLYLLRLQARCNAPPYTEVLSTSSSLTRCSPHRAPPGRLRPQPRRRCLCVRATVPDRLPDGSHEQHYGLVTKPELNGTSARFRH